MIDPELQAAFDAKLAKDRESFRAFLVDMGPRGIAALKDYDRAMRDLDSGVSHARDIWHSISPAQRRALVEAAEGKQPKVRTIATLRNLADRDLLAWDGGAFTPEARVVITERGLFVLRHGALPATD